MSKILKLIYKRKEKVFVFVFAYDTFSSPHLATSIYLSGQLHDMTLIRSSTVDSSDTMNSGSTRAATAAISVVSLSSLALIIWRRKSKTEVAAAATEESNQSGARDPPTPSVSRALTWHSFQSFSHFFHNSY